MRKLGKLIIGTLVGTLMFGMTVMAEEEKAYQVTPTSAVGYTNENTIIVADAMPTGAVVLTAEQCPDTIPLLVTGITDTGYWEVDLGQIDKYYILGPYLENITLTGDGDSGVENRNGSVETTTDNGSEDSFAYVDSDTALAVVRSGVSTAGEEACIQWLYVNRPNVVKTAYDIEICRFFYREITKLYELAKANPKDYTPYDSVYFADSIEDYSDAVEWYFNKTTYPYHFGNMNGGTFYVPNKNRIRGYRTDPDLLEKNGWVMR